MKTIIQTPTNNLAESIDFYTKLDFRSIGGSKNMFTDDKAVIEINPDRFARAGVKLYAEHWDEMVEKVEEITSVQKIEEGYLLSDPSGTWVYLIESEFDLDFKAAETSSSVLGNYAGISLETVSINQSFQLWNALGFTDQQGSIDQGWVALKNNDGLTISLMKPNTCPHLFFNPSLTYFNGVGNMEIIDKIRKLGIPLTEEITHFNKEGKVDNLIIRDPGGFGFFLFND